MQTFCRYRDSLRFFWPILPLTGCLFRSRRVEGQVSMCPAEVRHPRPKLIDYIRFPGR